MPSTTAAPHVSSSTPTSCNLLCFGSFPLTLLMARLHSASYASFLCSWRIASLRFPFPFARSDPPPRPAATCTSGQCYCLVIPTRLCNVDADHKAPRMLAMSHAHCTHAKSKNTPVQTCYKKYHSAFSWIVGVCRALSHIISHASSLSLFMPCNENSAQQWSMQSTCAIV